MRHNNSSVWRGLVMALGLVAGFLRAQVVGTDYTFATSNGTYNAIIGSGVSLNGDDDVIYFQSGRQVVTTGAVGQSLTGSGYPIGFTFRYGEQNYTTFAIGSNGYIKLGGPGDITLGNSYFNIWLGTSPYSGASSLFGIIAPFLNDMHLVNGGARIAYSTTGTAPNRTCIVQWEEMRSYVDGTNVDGNYNFQIRLNESSNTIQFVWGPTTAPTQDIYGYVIGLRGGSATDHFLIAGIPGTVARTTNPTQPNENGLFLMGQGVPGTIPSGFTMTFSPITTSIETEEVAVSDLRAFPTVMSDYLNVKGNVTRSGNLQLVLTDATGRTHQVRQVNGASGQLDERMAVSDLAPGFYVLDVRSGSSSQRIKLVKQ